jgi:hypothetical protein
VEKNWLKKVYFFSLGCCKKGMILKNRTLDVIVVLSILTGVIVGGVGVDIYMTVSPASTATTTQGAYLTYLNGTEVYLINSTLSYSGNAVVINSVVRNDYGREYYFAITGNLYTSGGEKIDGTKYITDPPANGFVVVHVFSHSVESFEIHFDYLKRDIQNYDLFLAFPPFDEPPP